MWSEPVPAALLQPPSVHEHWPIFAQSVQILCGNNFIINTVCSSSNSTNNIIQVIFGDHRCCYRWPECLNMNAHYTCGRCMAKFYFWNFGLKQKKEKQLKFTPEFVPFGGVWQSFADYLDSPSTSMSSPVNLSAAATNLSTYGGCNSPYKTQRQQTNVRERKRMMRSAPNGWVYHYYCQLALIHNVINLLNLNYFRNEIPLKWIEICSMELKHLKHFFSLSRNSYFFFL